jgi:hypothetical protein
MEQPGQQLEAAKQTAPVKRAKTRTDLGLPILIQVTDHGGTAVGVRSRYLPLMPRPAIGLGDEHNRCASGIPRQRFAAGGPILSR